MEYLIVWYLLDIIITIAFSVSDISDFKYTIALSLWTVIFITVTLFTYIKDKYKDILYILLDFIAILSIWCIKYIIIQYDKLYTTFWLLPMKILSNLIRLIINI